MPAAVSRAFSHGGDGPEPDVPEEPPDVARAALEVLDGHVRMLVAGELGLLARQRPQLGPEERRHLARDAVDREAVGPVAGQLDLEHLLPEREHVAERRPRLEGLREDEDPRVLAAQLELGLGEDHPVRDGAAELGALERAAVRQHRAGQRDRDGRARRRSSRPRRRSGAAPASPTSTLQSWSRSAFGCFPASTTRPTR